MAKFSKYQGGYISILAGGCSPKMRQGGTTPTRIYAPTKYVVLPLPCLFSNKQLPFEGLTSYIHAINIMNLLCQQQPIYLFITSLRPRPKFETLWVCKTPPIIFLSKCHCTRVSPAIHRPILFQIWVWDADYFITGFIFVAIINYLSFQQ